MTFGRILSILSDLRANPIVCVVIDACAPISLADTIAGICDGDIVEALTLLNLHEDDDLLDLLSDPDNLRYSKSVTQYALPSSSSPLVFNLARVLDAVSNGLGCRSGYPAANANGPGCSFGSSSGNGGKDGNNDVPILGQWHSCLRASEQQEGIATPFLTSDLIREIRVSSIAAEGEAKIWSQLD